MKKKSKKLKISRLERLTKIMRKIKHVTQFKISRSNENILKAFKRKSGHMQRNQKQRGEKNNEQSNVSQNLRNIYFTIQNSNIHHITNSSTNIISIYSQWVFPSKIGSSKILQVTSPLTHQSSQLFTVRNLCARYDIFKNKYESRL